MRKLTVLDDGSFRSDLTAAELQQVLAKPGSLVWLDLGNPDDADLAELSEAFHFHPLAIEDAVRAHERPKVDLYLAQENVALGSDGGAPTGNGNNAVPGNYYFLIFYEITLHENEQHIEVQPLSLFVGSNYLVTVHQAEICHIDETLARWQAPNSPLGNRISGVVHALLDAVVDDYFPLMDRVADRVDELEDSIFVQFDRQSIQSIFSLKKGLLNMRRVVAPERDVLNVLLRRELPIFARRDMAYFQDIYDHLVRVTDNVDTYRDLLSSALDSYLSLQSNNLNQVMKVLTMASIILMSNALIAGIYGMNFIHMPELHWQYGYVWALFLMVLVSTALIVYYRHKDWL